MGALHGLKGRLLLVWVVVATTLQCLYPLARSSERYIYVAKDDSGNTQTVQGAVDLVPEHNNEPVHIVIKAGVYREKVLVPFTKPYLSFVGQGSEVTILTWHDRASDKGSNGQRLGTLGSASVAIESTYFSAKDITFQNTAPASLPGAQGEQAVALRVSGDKAAFKNCRMIGSQDTLFDHVGRHYFLNCYIEGNVDFVFGDGRSLYQNCELHAKGNSFGAVAASQRNSPQDKMGFSFVESRLTGTAPMVYLGRAWGRYALIVYSECVFDDIVIPQGWSDWGDPSRRKTAFFGVYNCSGGGANSTDWVDWAKHLSYEEAQPFLDQRFIDGDQWLNFADW